MDTYIKSHVYSPLVATDDAFSALASTAFAAFELLILSSSDFTAFASTLITLAALATLVVGDLVSGSFSALASLGMDASFAAFADETFSAFASALKYVERAIICEHGCL